MHSRINAVYVVMDVLLTGMLDVVINAMTGGDWSAVDKPQCTVVLVVVPSR